MRYCIACFALLYCVPAISQQNGKGDSLLPTAAQFINHADNKVQKLKERTATVTQKALSRLEKNERRVYQYVQSHSPQVYLQLIFDTSKVYAQLKYKLASLQLMNDRKLSGLKDYIPSLDTLHSALSFLNTYSTLLQSPALKQAQETLLQYENQLEVISDIRKRIEQHVVLLQQKLQGVGISRLLKRMNKNVYYYNQQLKEFGEILKDRSKAEAKFFKLLKSNINFTEFFQKHSWLASLFPQPADYGTAAALQGLQTRAVLQNELVNRFGGSGVNPQQFIQDKLQGVQSELQKIIDKVNAVTGGSESIEIPGFKPNTQKTKRFFKRFEYGLNMQTHGSNNYLPSMADIGGSIGYKLNDKSVIGIGVAYKMGLGKGWNVIKFSSEGISLRSFLDWKIKKTWWVSSGFEYNYLQAFEKLNAIQNIDTWQQSGLIGITKKYKAGKKKEAKMQLLWNFLEKQNVPGHEAIVFRLGYSL